jgi:hypothetical protein
MLDPRYEQRGGYVGVADANINYRRRGPVRTFSLDGRTSTSAYSGLDLRPLVGGSLQASFDTLFVRTLHLRAAHQLAYWPTLVTGAFGPLAPGDLSSPPPDTAVSTGFLERQSVASTTMISLRQRWSAAHSLEGTASFAKTNYLTDLGYDNRRVAAGVSHYWGLTRRWTIRPSYHADDIELQQVAASVPLRSQRVELAAGYTRRLSPSRNVSFWAGGGTTQVKTVNAATGADLDYVMPSGHASLSVDVKRTWTLGANYHRGANVIQGLSLSSFASNIGSVELDGLISRRVQTTALVAYADGRAGSQQRGNYSSLSGSVLLRYALERCCALTMQYEYYDYRFRNLDLPPGVPMSYDRQALKLGFTLWVPLYTRFIRN